MMVSDSGLDKLKKFGQETLLFGNEPSPELIAILTVYFVQGILGLSTLAISFFLKDDLKLSPTEVGAFIGIGMAPWVAKPLFGFLSDGLPIFGYKRRSYLFLSGLIGTLSWIALGTIVETVWTTILAIFFSSLSVAISDVIADSLVVERVRKESVSASGSLQSLCWGISALGGLITAYLSGCLLEHFSTRTIFLVTATFPLIVSGVAWLIDEKNTISGMSSASVKHQVKELRRAITQKVILLPTLFIFLWQCTPTSSSAFFFFTTNELGFPPEFLGRVRLVTSVTALLGAWLFQRFFKSVPFRTIIGWGTVLSALLGMTNLLLVTHANRSLGIDDRWFSLGDSAILTVMGQITWMPVLVLSARLCPPGIEATLFALLMSIWNLSALVSQELGALLTHWLGVTETNFDNMWLLVVITNASSLLPLVFLKFLPVNDPQSELKSGGNPDLLPPAEVFEHQTTGSLVGQSLTPDLIPEFPISPVSRE
ncbi:MAG TPA: folate/biopterin family MFS transporter [Cyanobacteria bacterium UBA11149]|nr:folate/biopterin family MFS transporter [Cyanobacteria bacterium UBA11367]HBE56155.1 folate/biopterin family MFS transporter [Cyanobacteria bacterium UBA11366]HBK63392.1 folate/biopterin family MFS transporter [Cyanobacteria bacterium UBA11166]HBR73004.1 folate/biopterin family MFS transporter [Cyanobacteria bacterium UBA11159]HBS69424.1 folate/biopterin family MFS transporter [Cyanobacteria bacterium UBA11153]HBW91940.1 folate/biopterin family MFS transporter [Cyanobacteria bacterium UBA11